MQYFSKSGHDCCSTDDSACLEGINHYGILDIETQVIIKRTMRYVHDHGIISGYKLG